MSCRARKNFPETCLPRFRDGCRLCPRMPSLPGPAPQSRPGQRTCGTCRGSRALPHCCARRLFSLPATPDWRGSGNPRLLHPPKVLPQPAVTAELRQRRGQRRRLLRRCRKEARIQRTPSSRRPLARQVLQQRKGRVAVLQRREPADRDVAPESEPDRGEVSANHFATRATLPQRQETWQERSSGSFRTCPPGSVGFCPPPRSCSGAARSAPSPPVRSER